MSLEHEATDSNPTFDYFDRTWTLPPAVRYSHQRTMLRIGGNLGIIEALLDESQKVELEKIDPAAGELDGFTTAMAAAMGFGDAGNSEPSPASS